ncbi:LuxR C-terminal-related transcriptional regulator [Streptomyces calvus]|uniref:LuxR C-terminal-related transcriptional regulator n=1 Tax=Streptomyces calvus TaxID=67282 RepID=UPI003899AA91
MARQVVAQDTEVLAEAGTLGLPDAGRGAQRGAQDEQRRIRRAGGRAAPGLARLTAQERAVARLVAAGATNQQAALELFISVKTVQYLPPDACPREAGRALPQRTRRQFPGGSGRRGLTPAAVRALLPHVSYRITRKALTGRGGVRRMMPMSRTQQRLVRRRHVDFGHVVSAACCRA